jgi:hypothetical protein
VPVEELPPGILLTDQITVELVDPVTVAVNCWELPVLAVAGLGETETWICLGAGCWGVVPESVPRTAAHPARSSASTGKSFGNRRFKGISSTRLAEVVCFFAGAGYGRRDCR